jgi:hypothetical protein
MSEEKIGLRNDGFPYGRVTEERKLRTQFTEGGCFLVKIVFQIICGNGDHLPQFDEQLRLIFATDERSAFEAAIDQVNAESNLSEMVQWKFVAVTEIYPFSENLNGAALFSTITETEMSEAYIITQQKREKELFHTISC